MLSTIGGRSRSLLLVLFAVTLLFAPLVTGVLRTESVLGLWSTSNAEPGPGGEPATASPPPSDASRRGLHYTPEEVAIWRQRAVNGPFRSPTGPPQHYPGDWVRITRNADDFLSEPTQARWHGPVGDNSDGCVQPGGSGPGQNPYPPGSPTIRLRDAAFTYLISGEVAYRDAVKAALLWQARAPGTQFNDRERWCLAVIWDLPPSYDTAIWLTQLLYAYDYLGPGSFTRAERVILNDWFYHAADFWQHDMNRSHDGRYVDRWNGNYTLRHKSCSSNPRPGYYGSKDICTIAAFYNNRKAHIFRFVTSAGIKLHMEDYTPPASASPGVAPADLRRSGELFAKEWLMFSVYPEGFFGEFERWTEANPIQGWAYSAGVLSPVVAIADELARSGDRSAIDFRTRDGAWGSESGGKNWLTGEAASGSGPEKSLLFALKSYAKYVDGTYIRYGTANSNNLNDGYRIRSYHAPSNYYSNNDAGVMMANNYYQSGYIRGMYLRTGPGMPDYPARPAASQHGWMGNGRTYPGVLFMFGDLEGRVWPYGD